MRQAKSNQMTVGRWIADKVITNDWRAGKTEGERHFAHGGGTACNAKDSIRDLMEAVGGRSAFVRQVNALEREGLIRVKRINVNTEVKEITFARKDLDRLCDYEGIPNERKQVEKKKESLSRLLETVSCEWLKAYLQDAYRKLEKGSLGDKSGHETVIRILCAIAALDKDVWKRKFSSDVLNDSKQFKQVYEKRIVAILRKYSPYVEEDMTDDQILSEHRIMTYSQTLQFKGSLVYEVGNGPIDTGTQVYGTILNAQTLSHARLVSLNTVRRVMTVENQANYEQMHFCPDTLYIYAHGFFSPKERRFLEQIAAMADDTTEFYHWSDLDYGGIRIFQFMKKRVFGRVRPYRMDRTAYDQARQLGEGHDLDAAKRRKLEKLRCEELEELKQCILTHGKEYEQEMLIE